MEIIERNQDDVCLLPKPRDIVFPELRENTDMHLLCNKLKGTMSVTDSQVAQERLVKEFTKKMPDEYNEFSELKGSLQFILSICYLVFILQQCFGPDGMTLRMKAHMPML